MVIHQLVVISFNKILPRLKANAVSQPTLEPHNLCYTCWVQVVYSLLATLLFFLSLSFWDTLLLLSSRWRGGVYTELPGLRGLLGGRLPVDVPVAPSFRVSYLFYASAYSVSDIFVIYVINNICTRFIISFYVICAVIYCSFCCIYVWLDHGTHIRVTLVYQFYTLQKLHIFTHKSWATPVVHHTSLGEMTSKLTTWRLPR